MEKNLDLSIVIVNFNTKALTLACVDSIIKNTVGITYEIIIIDNASIDKLKIKNQRVKMIWNKTNLGFGAANNQGMRISRGRYIILLNSDTLIEDNLFSDMIKLMDKKLKIGVLGPKLVSKNGVVQQNGGYFPTFFRVFNWMFFIDDIPTLNEFIKPFHTRKKGVTHEIEQEWLTGACLLLRREAIRDAGYFDEDFFMYVEEVDYCFRLKRHDWKVIYNPKWQIVHLGGASTVRSFTIVAEFEGVKKFFKKHYPSWQFLPLRLILKIGALIRIPFFGAPYAKAFIEA